MWRVRYGEAQEGVVDAHEDKLTMKAERKD